MPVDLYENLNKCLTDVNESRDYKNKWKLENNIFTLM